MFNLKETSEALKFSNAEQRGIVLLLALLLFVSLILKVNYQSNKSINLVQFDTIHQQEPIIDSTSTPFIHTEDNRWMWANMP